MRRVQSTLFGLLAASGSVFADSAYNLTPGVSPISHDVYELHMTVLWICIVIGVVVFGAMFYAMYYHRKSRGAKAANFHSHTWLEVTWTVIPCLILIAMAIPATNVLLNMNNNDQEAVTIKITGYQWKWHYEYLEDNVSFFSNLSTPQDQIHNKAPKGPHYLLEVDHPLVLPIHKKVRFLITSNDVNHAWWVPALGVKRDAIAGIINEGWTIIDKPGTYRGQCAELCGINHAFMPIVVLALPEQAYKDWIAKQKGEATAGEADTNREWSLKELMAQGEQTYNKVCAACHQVTGLGTPPTFPAMKGSKVTIGRIDKHIEVVMNGVSGTAMQAFKTQLSDVELASVITYERNAWGNNTNTLVQPIQIKAYRDGKVIADALLVKPDAATALIDKAKPAAEVKLAPIPTTPTPVPVTPALNAGKAAPKAPVVEDPLKAAIARGEKVYQTTCAVCHQVNGAGIPPTFPALKDDPVATGPAALHISRVLNGKPGTAMQAFKDQMNDQDLADVITYERNAWGNDMGDLVKPEDIKAARALPPAN